MDKQTFSRKELYDMVWSEPLLSLSKKFDISDNGLRKICIGMDTPLPRAGHWQKIAYGGEVIKPPLSKKYSGKESVQLAIRSEESRMQMGKPSIRKITEQEIEQKVKPTTLLSKELINPDKLVIQTRKYLEKEHIDRYTYVGTVSCLRGNGLDTRVSKENILRAVCFWDVFIKALHARGHSIRLKENGTYLFIGDDDYEVRLREKSKKVVIKDGSWDRTQYHPIGIFALSVGYREWKDSSEKLGNKLSKIIADIEVSYEERKKEREEWQRRWAEQEERERIQMEYEKRKEKELNDFKKTLAKAKRWHKSHILRNYLEAFKNAKSAEGVLPTEIDAWVKWAENKADWYDPFIEKYDPLLEDIDRDTLNANKNKLS